MFPGYWSRRAARSQLCPWANPEKPLSQCLGLVHVHTQPACLGAPASISCHSDARVQADGIPGSQVCRPELFTSTQPSTTSCLGSVRAKARCFSFLCPQHLPPCCSWPEADKVSAMQPLSGLFLGQLQTSHPLSSATTLGGGLPKLLTISCHF